MLQIKEAIVVEGRYDKNTLSQMVDTLILSTEGFQIFHDREKTALLRAVARKRGIVIFTDSDGAGFVIRNYLKGCLPADQVKHAYIPDVPGKERRKSSPGKEGKLGVEGMTPEVLERCLRRAGVTVVGESAAQAPRRSITKLDLYRDGLSGGPDSRGKRRKLLQRLDLPEHLSASALPQVLDTLLTYEEYQMLVQKL